MTHHTDATPSTPRKYDWRDDSACQTEDPELFFPSGTDGGWKSTIYEAKAICARCPVATECLTFAFDEGITYGIFGGLTDHERLKLRRRRAAKLTAAEITDLDINEVRKPATLAEAFERHATTFGDGHQRWTGPKQLYFADTYYTPRRAGFLVANDTAAYGQVHPICGLAECVAPAHMEDAKGRTARKRAEKRDADQQAAAGRAAERRRTAA